MPQCEQCGNESPEQAGFCRQCGHELSGPDPLIGQEVLGRYRVTRLIGEGGMGRVYEGEQRVGTTSRRVAVKVLRPQLCADPQLARRFFREAETIVRLTHPNTIQFFDFGELANGTLAMVMEFIEGHSLAQELARGALDPARTDRVLAQIGGALAEAHALGIVHRDLKPDNILLTERGGQRDFVKILDFGIAQISSSEDTRGTRLTQQGMMVGTPPYMSPEQFSGQTVDARSDIYSLGVIAYEMLTGRLPFDARTPWEWASKHLTEEPNTLEIAAIPGVSERRVQAIRRALSKRPEQRPQDVGTWLAELGAVTAGASPQAGFTPSSPALRAPAPAQGTPVHADSIQIPTRPWTPHAWKLAAGLAVLGCAMGAALWLRSAGDRSVAVEAPALPPALPASITPASEPSTPREEAPAAPVPRGDQASKLSPKASQAPEGAPSASSEESARSARRSTAAGRSRPSAERVPGEPTTGRPAASGAAQSAASATPGASLEVSAAPPRPTAAAQSVAPTDPAMADLQARIQRALAMLPQRVDVALGLYQAAAARYGEHQPALVPLRRALAERGEAHVRELVAARRCAQAQAFYRALRTIGAHAGAQQHFGGGCAAP